MFDLEGAFEWFGAHANDDVVLVGSAASLRLLLVCSWFFFFVTPLLYCSRGAFRSLRELVW